MNVRVLLGLAALTVVLGIIGADYTFSTTLCDERICICNGANRMSCRCDNDKRELIIRATGAYKLLSSTKVIQIYDCSEVYFMQLALFDLDHLKHIRIENVSDLTLAEEALYWPANTERNRDTFPGINIHIINTTIREFASYSVKGRIDEIVIESCDVKSIKPYAFTNMMGTNKINIFDTKIGNIDGQAFRKFSLDSLQLNNVTVNTLQSRTFSDLTVTKHLKVHNLTVDTIMSSAFIINDPRTVSIEHCKINHMLGDSFVIETSGAVTFSHNTIERMDKGALRGMTATQKVVKLNGPRDFLFEQNTINNFEVESFNIDDESFDVIVKDLMMNKPCDCQETNWSHRFLFFEKNLMCIENNLYEYVETYKADWCKRAPFNLALAIMTVSVILLVIAAVIFFMWLGDRKNWFCMRWFNNNFSGRNHQGLVMPDGRTYRETELHVIVERAEMLTTDL